ncbi:hypothetical protein NEQG_01367 [Nematocida parisii ERTm3]|uniref:Uncharacterized protein n=1 Tax=Nematocida parisii (strain ERTm3) TaxID=935791 RepID=I3EHI0_NEMP3|nr:hypothetical protein NEQG_01367 [Nematocida parisii ERTm3]
MWHLTILIYIKIKSSLIFYNISDYIKIWIGFMYKWDNQTVCRHSCINERTKQHLQTNFQI